VGGGAIGARPVRSLGRRQDADAAVPGRAHPAGRRAHHRGRARLLRLGRGHRPVTAAATHRLRIPGVRALSASHRCEQHRLWPAAEPARGPRAADRGGRRASRPARARGTVSARALGWPAAAGGARPGAGHRSGAPAARRAALGPGHAAAQDPARRAAGDPNRMGNRGRGRHPRLHRGVPPRRSNRGVPERPCHPIGTPVGAALAAGVGGRGAHHRAPQRAPRHRREGDARSDPARLARPHARGGELADALVPAAAREPDRVLHSPGIRAAGAQGSCRAGRRPPHEPDARARRGRGGLWHGVVAPAPTHLVYEILEIERDRHWEFSIHRGSIHVLPT
jgi:hypothetical protein